MKIDTDSGIGGDAEGIADQSRPVRVEVGTSTDEIDPFFDSRFEG